MKVLVTGATGFVGSHIVRKLLSEGHTVRALVRPSSKLGPLEAAGVELHVGDLTDPTSLKGCCKGVNAVLHVACAVATTFATDEEAKKRFLEVNRNGTVNLAREVLKRKKLRFVHISSTAAMGTPRTEVVNEESPCYPTAPYQVSKREAELALLELHREENLNLVILRPCVIAGEGKDQGELLKMFKLVKKGVFPLIGRSKNLRKPMIMIDDLVDATLLAIKKGDAGEIFLVHSDGDHTLGEILEASKEVIGTNRAYLPVPLPVAKLAAWGFSWANRLRPSWNPPLTPERVALFVTHRTIDVSKARRELGFEPKHQNLVEMLGRTYRWYRDSGQID